MSHLPYHWPKVRIRDIAAPKKYALTGGPFGSNLITSDYRPDGVPVIRGSNLSSDTSFSFDDFVYVSEEKADELLPNNAYPGDLIVTQRGTLGQVGLIPRECNYKRFIVSQSQMKLTIDDAKADPYFVYFYFRSPIAIQAIKNLTITSGVPHINLEILRNFEIPLPPLATQHRIADILSAYDDLIANNNRRMALLEESIHLLYREWFVQLRFPGHERVEVVDGAPEGWEKKPLEKVGFLNYGKSLTADLRIPGDVPVYGSSGIVGSHNEALVQGPTIIVGRKGNIGSVFWSYKACYPIDTVFYINSEQSSLYLYHNLTFQNFISSDVAVPGLNRNYAHNLSMLIPSHSILTQFEAIAQPIHRQIAALQSYNERLATARDLLLPRLMSGEIAV